MPLMVDSTLLVEGSMTCRLSPPLLVAYTRTVAAEAGCPAMASIMPMPAAEASKVRVTVIMVAFLPTALIQAQSNRVVDGSSIRGTTVFLRLPDRRWWAV